MNHDQIRAAIKRAKLELIQGSNQSLPIMGRKRVSLRNIEEPNISYQTLPSNEDHARNEQFGSYGKLSDVLSPGKSLAKNPDMPPNDSAAVDIIANAPEVLETAGPDLPNEYQLEIYRLRRRVEELESVVKDRDGRIVKALGAIEDELQMWRSLLYQHVKETMGQVQSRVLRLESTMEYLKDKSAHVWPSLEIPARWKR